VIFVDTGAWFAVAVVSDKNHTVARQWMLDNTEVLVTSDDVVSETLTLLRARGESAMAVRVGEDFFAGEIARIAVVTEEDFQNAWEVFRDFKDKGWSFTDCTSKVLMERLGIKTAFAFDQHFRQFGSVEVVPG
jgi:predicted nucleic acid-binding protein